MNKYQERIEKLRNLFSVYKIDALLITKPADVSYFIGDKGGDISLYITENLAYLITDFRYREFASKFTWFSYSEDSILDVLKENKVKRIGVSRNSLSLDLYLELSKKLNLVPTGNSEYSIVNDLRIVKDEEEIEYTKKAQEIGCEAFKHILGFVKAGMTERQVQLELEYYMLSHGADGLSFDTIAVSGVKSSMPHGIPDEKVIENGEFLTLDYGCTYKGYHSDMTRTIAIGFASEEMKNVYDIVLKAQLNACQNIKAGLKGDVCHNFALDIIKDAGYGEYFGHGLGHGVGLEIHEAPRFSPIYKGEIPVNSIVSIEPGIYLPGKFGVRIEDLAVIKENGIINITNAPKELIII